MTAMNLRTALTLTLSPPTGEGTAIGHAEFLNDATTTTTRWYSKATANDSPSPIGWEKAGVRAFPF